MKRLFFSGALVIVLLTFSACGSAATPATTTIPKTANITLDTNPNPATMGATELVLTITDASGNPIEGARVDVSADHTDMSGMSMGGEATEQGGGKYSIKADFSMSGNWKLTVHVQDVGLDYNQEILLKVE